MRRTVDMRLKCDAIIRDRAQFRQTEDLKSSAVREDGSGPAGKGMEPAHLCDDLVPRTQVQMVRIIEHQAKP